MVHKATEEDKHKCPMCGSNHVDGVFEGKKMIIICLDCGFESA